MNSPSEVRRLLLLATVLSITGLVGCDPTEPGEPETLSHQAQEAKVFNGLTYNGLTYNGLTYNGLTYNGLTYNGLTNANFGAWFSQDRSLANEVMTYVVRCAMPANQTLTYTDPTTGQAYTWTGSLGLTPGWAGGALPTEQEQQIITACLAAHVNRHGQHVLFSLRGRNAVNVEIPTGITELLEFPRQEGCFFGNLFKGEGAYAGDDRRLLDVRESTTRACSLASTTSTSQSNCPPMAQLGTCATFCTLNSAKGYYTECTYNGVTYMPLTTRLQMLDIHLCGDLVCQMGESCGMGVSYDNCLLDCGPCS